MPLVVPGCAMYGSLFAFGAASFMVMSLKFWLNRCFFTKISSCEKAHSSADSRAVDGLVLLVPGELALAGGVLIDD